MALQIVNDANRCLNCKKPMCQQYCPVHTQIPKVISLFKEQKIYEAGELLFENNPLSAVCATVCDHGEQCYGHCVLGKKGTPIHFYEIEKYISDSYLDRMKIQIPKEKKEAVAVIGSGPAGITVAVMLAKKGYRVTIFEEKSHIGGMLYYGIPSFRLSKSLLLKYKDRLHDFGIQIRPNTVIGGDLTIESMLRDGYAAIFIGTGTWRPKTLGIQGETLANVHYGISYLRNPGAFNLGKNVAVIGMGNVAMDVARTALRNGAEKVTLYARGKRIAASPHEAEYAKLDGAEFAFGKAIEKIEEDGPVFKISIFNENDKVIGYEEKREKIPADSVIIAASQGPKNKLVLTTPGLESTDKGLLICDEYGRTTRKEIFAAGDVVHGAKTVVHAVEAAKTAVETMIEYIENKGDE